MNITFIVRYVLEVMLSLLRRIREYFFGNKNGDQNGEDCSQFDLAQFMPDSLSLQVIAASQSRMLYRKEFPDPYEHLFKEDPLEVLEGKSFREPRLVPTEVIGTPIQEFYRDSQVFITGGTGFVGKILTEKLIRSVPHIKKIYILIREKRGKRVEERFEQLLQNEVFKRMRAEVPDYRDKITFMSGNISQPSLGLCESDRQKLLENVNVIFHNAADVRFIEPLKEAIFSNVLGSQRVMELAKEMINLKAFVHVSTAYSQCVYRVVPEAVPKVAVNYKDVVKLVESTPETDIEKNLYRIMQGWPNTYTFSKALCEDMIQEDRGGLPICVFRPSAIVTTAKEPVRGWSDNIYGPLGVSLGCAMGVIHCFPADVELSLDMVPVDLVVNCMIACAWNTNLNRNQEKIPVFNYVSTPAVNVLWKKLLRIGDYLADKWPYYNAIWYQSFTYSSFGYKDQLMHFFLHKIPGIVLDRVAVLAGQKPRLTKVYNTIQDVKKHLEYFSTRTWEFESENVNFLWASLSEEDRQEFPFDIKDVDASEVAMIGKLGLRYYYSKEAMETLPAAERKNRWFYWAHQTLRGLSGIVVLKCLVWIAHLVPI